MTATIAVVGGGVVGVASALALQESGYAVTVFEPEPIGHRTSYGNSGVLVENPWLAANNPGLWRNLPRIIGGRDPGVRIDWRFVVRRLPTFGAFLRRTSAADASATALALHALLVASQRQHKRWIAACGSGDLLRATGWLKVFRTADRFREFARELRLIRQTGTAHRALSPQGIADLEPGLKGRFQYGLFLPDACSLESPLALTESYFRAFRQGGGALTAGRVVGLDRQRGGRWRVAEDGGGAQLFDQVVVAAGPWSSEVLVDLGYRIPMFWERGYHQHLSPGAAAGLSRAVHVVDDGFVMSPQAQGTRVTSGVEIAHRDSPPDYTQIRSAVARARSLTGLGAPVEATPWMGSRPSLVDGLPMIGPSPAHEGLWFNFGHHHIGLSLAAGSALLLVAMMKGRPPPVDPSPFRPERFRRRAPGPAARDYAAAAVPGVKLP